jgi:hypothetical protein
MANYDTVSWWEGIKGREKEPGEKGIMFHPHPNPLPSRERVNFL